MSYCRWSSDDYQCDIYVSGTYEIYVATNRPDYQEPLPKRVSLDDMGAYLERHNKVLELLNSAPRVAIGLPHDGESFSESSPGAAADRLEELQSIGYRVPGYAIEQLREEQRET